MKKVFRIIIPLIIAYISLGLIILGIKCFGFIDNGGVALGNFLAFLFGFEFCFVGGIIYITNVKNIMEDINRVE